MAWNHRPHVPSSIRHLSWSAAILCLAACQETRTNAETTTIPAARVPQVVTLQGATMGTTYHVKVVAQDAAQSASAVALQAKMDAVLEQVNDQMSTYRPQSELSRFNEHASKAPFPVSADTARVTARALEIGRLTEGAFDVTLGPLISLWGFDRGGKRDTPPGPEEIAEAQKRVGLSLLHVEGNALRKDHEGVYVNLSGIAKGWGVDRVYDVLVQAGFADFMVEIGGEVRARGRHPRGEPWRIGINTPRADSDPEAILLAVPLADVALATSGDYRNFFESDGRRYAHILSPQSGQPVTRELVSASIIAPDCTLADALATAAIVLGAEKTKEILRRDFPGTEALFVHKPDPGSTVFRVSQTPGFPARLGEPSAPAP